MITSFGRKYTDFLKPLVVVLARIGIKPDILSILGLIMGIASGLSFAIGSFVCGSISLIFAGFFDIIDGHLARISNKSSKFGAFLDSSLDRYSDSFVFFGIIYYFRESPILTIIGFFALIGAYLTSYTKARAEKWTEVEIGIIERPERIILLIIGGLTRMDVILWLLAIFGNITVIQRILWTRRLLKGEQN